MTDQGYCPQCKVNLTTRTKKFGTFPRCSLCLEKNKIGRYERRNAKVRSDRSAHINSKGVRYPDHASMVSVECRFCKGTFLRSSRLRGRYVCPQCQPKADEERRDRNLKKVKDLYWNNPELARRKRLARTLRQMGLSIQWYDDQPKVCGICGTMDPGKIGWCLDHDHQCCPYGPRSGCSKCIRGLLCTNCNAGLGQFRDDPARLQAAIAWIQRFKK
jgi:hypothetical protein